MNYLGVVVKRDLQYLANLSELINFCFPWNRQKTIGFMMISGKIEVNPFSTNVPLM